jgi:energy-coupling factor transporter ATP-binding protein EcfA2
MKKSTKKPTKINDEKINDEKISKNITSTNADEHCDRFPAKPNAQEVASNEFKPRNYYKHCSTSNAHRQNSNRLSIKHPSMNLIVGGTGAGKTNLALMNLLLNEQVRLQWDKIYVFCRFPDEPLYQMLSEHSDKIKQKFETMTGDTLGYEPVEIFDSLDALPDFQTLTAMIKSDIQTVMVFDDFMMADKKSLKIISDYYTWVRKCNVSTFFLAQRNSLVDRTIRVNIDNVILFNPDTKKETNILAADYAGDLSVDQFANMLASVTTRVPGQTPNFLLIDTHQPDRSIKYRKNLLTPINPDDFVAH